MHDCYVGWVEALRELGQKVAEFNLSERLTFYGSALIEVREQMFRRALTSEQAQELAINGVYAALYKTRPDVLFVVSSFFYPTEMLDLARASGTRVVVLHTESPYEDSRQLKVAEHADLNLINDPTNLEAFQRVAPTIYTPHSYRPGLHRPGPPNPKLQADLTFVGTGYPSRVKFLEAMDLSGLDVLLAGNWQILSEDSPLRGYVAHEPDECLDNAQTAEVYRSAKVGLNLYRREAEEDRLIDGWACGPREIEMAACGTFFLRDPRPESDELLPMLPAFTSPGEATERLRYWLARPEKRRELAQQARAAVADRTFTTRAAELLALLESH